MFDFFRALFGTDFMPHLYCLRNDPAVLWLQVISDLAIAAAYFAIPLVLAQVVLKRKEVLFRKVAVLFVLFIAACGTTHLLEVWTIWHPMYRLEGVVKGMTAIFSIVTAIVLVRLRPDILTLPSSGELQAEIEQRRRAEADTHAEQERVRTIAESVQDHGLFMIDEQGMVMNWNIGAERQKGYKAEEIVGKHFSCFYTPEDSIAGKPQEAMRTALEIGQFEDQGWRMRKDGSRFWAQVVMRPVRDGDGNLRGFSKITHDLTQSRTMEMRYQTLLEAAPDAIIIVNRQGKIEFANSQMERLFGYTRLEIHGKSVDSLVPARFRGTHGDYRHSFFDSPANREMGAGRELLGLRRDGTEFSVEISLSPLETRSGPVVLAAVRDVSERKKAETRFRALLESAPDAMVIVNSDGFIELANTQTERLFGYSRLELVGQSVDVLVPQDLRGGHFAHRDRFFANPKPRSMGAGLDLMAVRKDGTQFPVEISLSPLEGPDGVSVTAAIRDVTDRKKAEMRFRALLDSAPDAMVISNPEGIIELINRQTERLFGYSREEMVGRHVEMLIPQDLRRDYGQDAREFLSGDFQREMGAGLDLRARRKDGSEFPVEIRFSPLEGPNGISMTAAIRDITERRKSETRFRALLESAPDAMVIVNSQGLIELANLQVEKLFGYSGLELVGQSVDVLVPQELRGGHFAHRDRFFASPKPRSMGAGLDLMAVRKDGTQFPVEISLSPLEGPDGVSVTAAIRDVTERKKAETRFRALLESAPDAMVIANGEGVIELANLQTERLFGYPRMELVGQSVDVLVPASLRSGHGAHRARFFADPRPREMGAGLDLMAVRKDGTQFPVEISLSPLEGPGEISVTAAIRDVSERKRAERQLSEKMTELRQSNEALEQFAHIASHDLQEPLRMVASYTQLLARRYKGKLDADADEFIGYAVDGTQRMKRLIEDLLVYSRAGRSAPAAKELDSEDALREALGNLQAAIEESGAEVTLDALPKVTAAELQLVQLFQNLVGNAIKYRGERTPQIHVSARSTATEWIFSVADNGIGIEAKYFDRVFVIFQRLHGRGEYEGTGIGLAICKRILQQQGGRIWVESEPGVGSTFYFALPVR